MRSEKLYLADILEAARVIRQFCAGTQYADFMLTSPWTGTLYGQQLPKMCQLSKHR
jgi:hypothetical protein